MTLPPTTATSVVAVALLSLSCLDGRSVVGAFAPLSTRPSFSPPARTFILATASTEDETASGDDDEPKLILGKDAEEQLKSIESKLGELGSEAGYLAAAKRRQEEAKAKMLAEHEAEMRAAEEWEAARTKAAEEGGEGEAGPSEANYGPGDLSQAGSILVAGDDGWEKSLGKDEDNLMGGPAATGEEDDDNDKEEPTLFIPGGDEGDGPIVF